MSRGIGKLQRALLDVMIKDQTGEGSEAHPNGAYSTPLGLLHESVGVTSPTDKRKVRRALQGLESRGLARRDKRNWCAVTPELEAMREQRDREFRELLNR